MGDMSELKPLVTITVFVASFILLMGYFPSFIGTGYDEYRTIAYKDYWDSATIRNYADINSTVIDNGDLDTWVWLPDYPTVSDVYEQYLDDGDGDFGGYDGIHLLTRFQANGSEGRVYFAYPKQRFWIFTTAWGFGEWYFANRTAITINQYANNIQWLNKFTLDDLYLEQSLQNYTSFKIKMDYEGTQEVWFDVHFSFNTTTFGAPQYAWDSAGAGIPDELYVLSGIDFDQTRTAYGAYNILEALLFFNLPQVLGGLPVIFGAFLSIIVWGALIYISFILILRAIGAVFGGGA